MQTFPFFSIIIPTYNRPEPLRACLETLARLDYPRDRFEVIVVEDGSETPPDRVVASFRHELDVTLLLQPHAGPAAARNTGAARARGEFLAFTDDDCAPAPTWLQALEAHFARAPEAAVAGRTVNALGDNVYSAASQLLVSYLCEYYNADPQAARFSTSNNLAAPAHCFRQIGGFDHITFRSAAAEDREFCDRWLHTGYRLVYAPDALVYHAHELSLRTFWRQHFNYGRGAFRFHQARARRHQTRFKIEPPSFYLNLIRAGLSQKPMGRRLMLTSLLLISQAANLKGFLWEAVRHVMKGPSLARFL